MTAEKYLKKAKQEVRPVNEWGVEEWETAYNALAQKNKQLTAALSSALTTLSRAVSLVI